MNRPHPRDPPYLRTCTGDNTCEHHYPLLPPTRNARLRREVLLPLPPLPCSKRKTEGHFFFNHPPLLPPLLKTQDGRGLFLCQPPPLLPSLLEMQDGGGMFLLQPPPPSLARNARWRGRFLIQPPLPLPHSKHETWENHL